MNLKCNFDLPETGKSCWDEERAVFEGDPVNRSYEIIEVKKKIKRIKKMQKL